MPDDPRRHLRTEARSADLRQALQGPTDTLIAATPPMAEGLRQLDIVTIFDLATSRVFANAASIDRAGDDESHLFRRAGTLTADVVTTGIPAGIPVEELRTHKIGVLAGIGTSLEQMISEQLGVSTIQELANLPAFLASKEILDHVFFPETLSGFDPDAPADLVPRNGIYPTERVSYTTLLFDYLPSGPGDEPETNILGGDFQPINVANSTTDDWGFKKVAFGTLLTFTQSWYQEGVALGQLLHSTALAPGESTRIAVIDWSRRSRAGQTEADIQSEDLTNDTQQNRGISEVTAAVAREAQGGFSNSRQRSSSTQQSVATGGPSQGGTDLGGAVTGLVEGGVKAVTGAVGAVESLLGF